jgi:Glycosyltransferase
LLEVPSVACASGGTPDCIVQGETGVLVESKDEIKFAAVVSELIMQPEKRSEMGRRAKAWVQSRFAMETVSAQYLRFYREVLDASNNGKSN